MEASIKSSSSKYFTADFLLKERHFGLSKKIRSTTAMGSSVMGKRGAVLLALALACWICLFVSPIAAEEAAGASSDVLVLHISNFTENVKKYDILVVEFYAPWCGHCKSLAPKYEVAATTLKTNDPPIALAKVDLDAEENKPLASEYGIQGFPTLKVFRNKGATVLEYKGPREDADGIVSHLTKMVGPPSLEVTSAAQAEKLLATNKNEMVIVGVFKSLGGDDYTNFIEAADSLRSDYVFAHTVDASYIPDNGVPLKVPSVRVHKSFDDKIADTTDFSVEGLKAFYEGESLPLAIELSKKPEDGAALMRFFKSKKDKVFYFVEPSETSDDDEDEVETESADAASLSLFAKNAKAYQEKGLIFLFTRTQDSANALQFFGISVAQLPAYVIQTGGGKKHIQTNFKPEQLGPWLDEFLAGKLTEHVKSEPIPTANDKPVKVIVAKTLKKEVLESGKDVFVEFDAPWCGHCKKLAPVLDEVALSYESDPNVVIAKIDATANDVPNDIFDVKGFPTMYLHTAGGDVIQYESDRTKETIMQFIDFHRAQAGKSDDAGIPEISTEIPLETVTTGVKDEL